MMEMEAILLTQLFTAMVLLDQAHTPLVQTRDILLLLQPVGMIEVVITQELLLEQEVILGGNKIHKYPSAE